MTKPVSVLTVRDDDIMAEKWTYGHYEVDGHYTGRESGGELVLSDKRFDSKQEVSKWLYKNLTDSEWMYDIFRIMIVHDYEVADRS